MSGKPEDNLFKVLNAEKNSLTIIQNVQGSQEENVLIENVSPVKTQDGKAAELFTTDKGRKFARLKEWPEDTLLEVH